MSRRLGSVELGGAKVICAVHEDAGADGPGPEIARLRIPTEQPGPTLERAAAFLVGHGPLDGLGIAAFGPVRLDEQAPDFGRLIRTPKPGWSGADLLAAFKGLAGGRVRLDTDVNAAALSEALWGAAKGARSCAYVTVGSGIGVGVLVAGDTVKGLMHPEFGHMRPPRVAGDAFAGSCPFHGDCYEGLASGQAFAKRWGQNLADLPDEHPALDLHAAYLGRLCADVLLAVSPHRIVIGGGGMADRLMPRIRAAALEALAGYPPADRLEAEPDLIVRPRFEDAGLMGGFALARRAAEGEPA